MSNAILKKNILKSSLLVASSVGLVLSFQNCGKPGFDSTGMDESSLSVSGVTESLTAKSAPFLYDATFDTISYNSCSRPGNSGDADGNYSIKAGAYDTGGLALVPAAIDYAAKNLTPEYPNNTVTYEQSKAFLSNSSVNKGMRLQSTLRAFDAANGYPLATAFTDGREVKSVLGDVSTDYFLGPLFKKAQTPTSGGYYTAPTDRYFGLAGYGERKFEMGITLNVGNFTGIDAEMEAVKWRRYMTASNSTPAMLALSFKGPSDQYTQVHLDPSRKNAKGAEVSPQAYRGRGYLLDFTNFQNTNGAETTLLSNVSEIDLSTGDAAADSRGWSCLAEDRLVIVRQDDAATYCPVEDVNKAIAGLSTPSGGWAAWRARKLEVFRRHIPSSWRINVEMGCVVPPSSVACYDTTPVNNPFDPNYTTYAYDPQNQSKIGKIPRPVSYVQNGLHIYQGTLPPAASNYALPCQHFTKTSNPDYPSTIVQCAQTISFCRRN